MGKKARALLVAAVMSATTLTIGPARANEAADCFSVWFPVGPQSIEINGLTIGVFPDRVRGDVDNLADWAVDNTYWRVLCVEGGLVTGKVQCFIDKLMEIIGSIDPLTLNFRYVYPNSEGGYNIDGNRLVADLTAC